MKVYLIIDIDNPTATGMFEGESEQDALERALPGVEVCGARPQRPGYEFVTTDDKYFNVVAAELNTWTMFQR